MNYLSHGYRLVGDPWLTAGAALPDWLRVLDRQLRIPADVASERTSDADPRCAALARGVLRHYRDDAAFHTSRGFRETAHEIADRLRPIRAAVPGVRTFFVAHILVEALLDTEVVREDPSRVDAYYGALASLDPAEVETVAARLTPVPPAGLARLVESFVRARFVDDYADDARLARRLDQVFVRTRQPRVADALIPLLPGLRAVVRARAASMLPA